MTATSAPEFPAEDNSENPLGAPDVRARLAAQGITEADVVDAVVWARHAFPDLA